MQKKIIQQDVESEPTDQYPVSQDDRKKSLIRLGKKVFCGTTMAWSSGCIRIHKRKL